MECRVAGRDPETQLWLPPTPYQNQNHINILINFLSETRLESFGTLGLETEMRSTLVLDFIKVNMVQIVGSFWIVGLVKGEAGSWLVARIDLQ